MLAGIVVGCPCVSVAAAAVVACFVVVFVVISSFHLVFSLLRHLCFNFYVKLAKNFLTKKLYLYDNSQ